MNLDLKKLIAADPFVPFEILIAGGGRYRVEDPGLTAFGDNTISLMHPKSDRYDILRLSLIGAIEVLDLPDSATKV